MYNDTETEWEGKPNSVYYLVSQHIAFGIIMWWFPLLSVWLCLTGTYSGWELQACLSVFKMFTRPQKDIKKKALAKNITSGTLLYSAVEKVMEFSLQEKENKQTLGIMMTLSFSTIQNPDDCSLCKTFVRGPAVVFLVFFSLSLDWPSVTCYDCLCERGSSKLWNTVYSTLDI